MSKHIHAEAMLQYAQDAMETDAPWELWEYRRANYNGPWDELETNPTWCEYNRYRRKPRTININGHVVSEPVRRPLASECKYFVPSVDEFYLTAEYNWQDDETDKRLLKRGLIHLTEEAATTHAKALLSFTAKENKDE